MLRLTFEFPAVRGGLIIAIQSQSSLLECEFPTNALFATFVRVPATMLFMTGAMSLLEKPQV
jgi:hypothetical protein